MAKKGCPYCGYHETIGNGYYLNMYNKRVHRLRCKRCKKTWTEY